ncbi:hypothetical protein ACFFIO_00460 [Citricoccus parietis]|uniref:Uncharacterized protein n=2 Tax=Citricoccus parietis TaxID=592307 RepID=A0ABV6F0C6_9MICC
MRFGHGVQQCADIWRSKSKNVAEDCHENPEGWACGNPFVEE